jgi:metal-responsive CopG/Arc/MetJ family transcriptional regulator
MSTADVGDDPGVKQRVTVSLAPEVATGLKTAADHAGASSVSAYVEDAVRDRMRRDAWLERWQELAGPVDPTALAYARRALAGGHVEQRSRAS